VAPTRPKKATKTRKGRSESSLVPAAPTPAKTSRGITKATSALVLQAERSRDAGVDSLRIAVWMHDHPGSTLQQAADALGLLRYRVRLLLPMARTYFDGYLIPPSKPRKVRFTEAEMFAALKTCAKRLGIRKGEALSRAQYADWRAGLPLTSSNRKDLTQARLPSHLAYRRRYGTWTNAIKLAGLTANEPPREYDGLEEEDKILWIAVWLRSLTQRGEGLIDASQRQYRIWERSNPQAPCEEVLTMRGTWARLLAAAAELEKNTKKLPKPKAVVEGGRMTNPKR